MTTIACDGASMSGDGQINRNDFVASLEEEKVFRAADGALIGTCGVASVGRLFIEWYEAGAGGKFEQGERANALVLKPDGTLVFYGDCGYGNPCQPPQAIGSGSPYAMAVMLAKHSAAEAVEIACRLDPHSGGKITTLKLKEGPET